MAKGQENGGDSTEFMMILLVVTIAVIAFLISYYKQELLIPWMYLRIGESYVLQWIDMLLPSFLSMHLADVNEFLKLANYKEISDDTVALVDQSLIYYVGPLCGLAIFRLGQKMDRRAAGGTTRHNINSLLKERAKVFNHLNDYIDFDPNKENLDFDRDNPLSMKHSAPLNIKEFCLLNPPIGLEEQAKRDYSLYKTLWDKKKRFEVDLATKSLESQLGTPYKGVEKIDAEYLIAYSFIKAKLKITRDEAYEILINIVVKINAKKELSWAEKQLYNTMIDKKGNLTFELNKKSISKAYKQLASSSDKKTKALEIKAEKIMSAHAFVSTGLISLMHEASSRDNFGLYTIRNKLKESNRPLYYALNSVGRTGSFAESCGISTHHAFEKDSGKPSHVPQVELAVIEIQKELKII